MRITLFALAIVIPHVSVSAAPPRDDLKIVTEPPGASIIVKPDGIRCTSPCSLKLSRLVGYDIEISLPGYVTRSVEVTAGSGQFRTVDRLTPNPVEVTLERHGPPAGGTSPADSVASLDNCIQPAAVDRETCLGRLKLQMPRDVVEAVLGVPDGKSRDGKTLRYGDRFLHFDAEDTLAEISDRPRP